MTKSYRIGKTNTNTNGQKMTIIAYHDTNNIDIKFDDGEIICDRTYTAFCNGHIKHPSKRISKALPRLGETRYNSKGYLMKIIAYRDANNMDIEFENGEILINRTYYHFKNGHIRHPNPPKIKKVKPINPRIGEKNIANCGMEMTIIKHQNNRNIDVQFADGTIAVHKTYQNFRTGFIAHPNKQRRKSKNETT